MAEEFTGPNALVRYLTGAASNGGAQTSQAASLGNYRSSTRIGGLDFSVTNPISNITIDYVSAENGIGTGTLTADDVDLVSYVAPGDTYSGEQVMIADGETHTVFSDTASKYIVISRTSADDLTGAADIATAYPQNNVISMSDADSTENAAGSVKYRAIAIKNESGADVTGVKAFLSPIGTQRVSSAAQLSGSGSGAIAAGTNDFSDWETSGFCRIETSGDVVREVVYYSSRTGDTLTVPAAGRGLLGTSAAAGSATDKLYNVPGLRIAKDPSYPAQTIANEDTAPTGVSWSTQENAADGVNIGTLAAGDTVVLWLERTIIAGSSSNAAVLNAIKYNFDAVF